MHATALETSDTAFPGGVGLLDLAVEPELGAGPLYFAKDIVGDAEAVLAKVAVAKDECPARGGGRLGDGREGEVERGERGREKCRQRINARNGHARLDDFGRLRRTRALALLTGDRACLAVAVAVDLVVLVASLGRGRERDGRRSRPLHFGLELGLGFGRGGCLGRRRWHNARRAARGRPIRHD